ncbi:MAG: DUF5678 domain-containing protein [Nitrospirota bacterium]
MAMTQDQRWIHEHFEELVEKYAGKYVAVVKGELIAVGESAGEVEKIAREKYPDFIPSVLLVPRPEDFVCVL